MRKDRTRRETPTRKDLENEAKTILERLEGGYGHTLGEQDLRHIIYHLSGDRDLEELTLPEAVNTLRNVEIVLGKTGLGKTQELSS